MESSELDRFVLEIESIKDDMKTMKMLHKRLQDANEQSKIVEGTANVKELQAIMDSDIDHVFELAKAIMKRLEGLERSDAAPDTKVSRPGSSVDRTRMTIFMGLGKKLKEMMDGFQGLRVKIVGVHKECVESTYYSITKQKQSVETIEKLVSNGEMDAFLMAARDEQGSVRILDVVQEIQERINGAKYMQQCLIDLHKMYEEMVALVDAMGPYAGSSETRVVQGNSLVSSRVALAQLQDPKDHAADPKKRATIALILVIVLIIILVIALILVIVLIVPFIKLESNAGRDLSLSFEQSAQ